MSQPSIDEAWLKVKAYYEGANYRDEKTGEKFRFKGRPTDENILQLYWSMMKLGGSAHQHFDREPVLYKNYLAKSGLVEKKSKKD